MKEAFEPEVVVMLIIVVLAALAGTGSCRSEDDAWQTSPVEVQEQAHVERIEAKYK